MFCSRCQNRVSACECGDIEERLQELAEHPNFATDRCAGCQNHPENCTCEEYSPIDDDPLDTGAEEDLDE